MGVFQNKKTGKWKAEIWNKGRKVSSKTFTKKILADKYFKEKSLEAENQLAIGSIAKDYTYDECYRFWQENAISRLSQRTQIKNNQLNHNYISPIIGHLKISEITIFQFELIVSSLVRKGLSKASINLVIQHFKSVFNYVHKHDLIIKNPAKNYTQLKLPKKEMDYFSQDEMEQFLSYTNLKYVGKDRWKHVLYLTLFLTGGRLGEVLALEWNRINFENDLIIISQMWDAVNNKLVFTTKGRKDRVVPLNSLLKKELGAIKNYSNGSFLFSDVGDRPIDPSNFRSRNWEKDLKAVGIRKLRIHDCRHTYASLFVMNSGKLYDLKNILGHSDMKTTERYAHLSKDHFASVKDIIKVNIENHAEVISTERVNFKKLTPSIHPRNENTSASNF